MHPNTNTGQHTYITSHHKVLWQWEVVFGYLKRVCCMFSVKPFSRQSTCLSGHHSAQAAFHEPAMVTSTKTSDQPVREKSMLALTTLATKFGKKMECTLLAANLGFRGPDIMKYLRSQDCIEDIAADILLSWYSRTTGTREGAQSVLETALLQIKRPDLIFYFRKNLKNPTWIFKIRHCLFIWFSQVLGGHFEQTVFVSNPIIPILSSNFPFTE